MWQRVSWQGRPRSFHTGNGMLIAQLQQEMEYVHPALPCIAVAMRGSGLIGSSVRGADLSLTSKHIWPHLYPSKCDLGPVFFFWKESNSISLSETMPSNFFFVIPTTREIRADGGGSAPHVTSHLYSVSGITSVNHNAGWTSLEPRFCIIARDYTRCFTSDEQTNLHVCEPFVVSTSCDGKRRPGRTPTV